MTGVLKRRGNLDTDTHRGKVMQRHEERRQLSDDGGRDWSDAVTAKECLGLPETGGGKEVSSPRSIREPGPADTLILDFWTPEL